MKYDGQWSVTGPETLLCVWCDVREKCEGGRSLGSSQQQMMQGLCLLQGVCSAQECKSYLADLCSTCTCPSANVAEF